MDNRIYSIIIEDQKKGKAEKVFEGEITEEQFIWVVDYLRRCEEKKSSGF